MSAFFRWVADHRLLTLVGFGVILLGAFIPWPSLAIAGVVIVLGALLMVVQIPIAMRDGTKDVDQLEELELPEAWQRNTTEPAPTWQPANITSFQQPLPGSQPESRQKSAPYQHPEPYQPVAPYQPPPEKHPEQEAPATPWRPQNIPQYPQP